MSTNNTKWEGLVWALPEPAVTEAGTFPFYFAAIIPKQMGWPWRVVRSCLRYFAQPEDIASLLQQHKSLPAVRVPIPGTNRGITYIYKCEEDASTGAEPVMRLETESGPDLDLFLPGPQEPAIQPPAPPPSHSNSIDIDW